jgi:hypothetical protein
MILSIDVGSRNLGLCVVGAEKQLRHWKLVELPTPLTAKGVSETLEKSIQDWDFETVVIERQPGKNMAMQRVQYYCEMLFHCLGKEVVLMEARAKLVFASKTSWWPEDIPIAKKWSYYTRKTAAVKTVRAYLKETNSEFATYFESCPKKDDLADALLQALTWLVKI